ncbi:DoxX family membrane protein [Candidatus Kaiserbacteria bacterium]|nr:DoxX family membrane protein [Candidatus Kaiserbacteria bacterium]
MMYSVLNIFPVQFLSMFAYFILRVVVGFLFLYLAKTHYKHRNHLAESFRLTWWPYGKFSATLFILFEFILGLMFVMGAYTQIAALITFLLSAKMLVVRNWFNTKLLPPKIFWLLLLAVSLSIFITGAGVFAVDLPI